MTAPTANERKKTLWSRAEHLARQTPASRNRYVDFLRAFSIMAVVIGHWLVAAPYVENGVVQGGHLLALQPWTQWLTWGFQVMPVFFLVGGFSNGVSWSAALRKGGSYSEWFAGRLQRLVTPVLPLFLLWTLVILFGTSLGIERSIIKLASALALIPVWFLAVYLMVAALVPMTFLAWKRFGIASFWAFAACAGFIDLLTLGFGVPYAKYANFVFIWLAIHQLGYAWHDGYFSAPKRAWMWAAGALAVLAMLIGLGPYPVAMIGVPDSTITNSMPPKIALLTLGVMQTGIVLALEPFGRRMLENLKAWTGVVLINAMIMTIYLWHLTAFILIITAAWLLGGVGLEVVPGSGAWWSARPVWFALYTALLFPLLMIFARYEQISQKDTLAPVVSWRLIAGLVCVCAGLAATPILSIASPEGVTGVRLWIVALPFIGAALAGFGPVHNLLQRVRAG